ncbi:MAG: hypothetical protein PHQ98_04115 [Candidatus ainarchaeum sp.]|nr:hypothetical protein [Candidatus ainarchaeum sp.]
MKKIMIGGIVSLLLIMLIGSVMAYQGNSQIQGPNYSIERHDAMTNAFENNDYDAWYALMSENEKSPRVLEIVNKENFSTFVEMHNAMISGDTDKANELRAELGLGQGQMKRGNNQQGQGLKTGNGQRNQSCLRQ